MVGSSAGSSWRTVNLPLLQAYFRLPTAYSEMPAEEVLANYNHFTTTPLLSEPSVLHTSIYALSAPFMLMRVSIAKLKILYGV